MAAVDRSDPGVEVHLGSPLTAVVAVASVASIPPGRPAGGASGWG